MARWGGRGVADVGDEWVMVGSVGEMFGDLEVRDEGEEILGGPSEVECGCVEFWGASFKVSVDKVGVFSFVVEDSEAVVRCQDMVFFELLSRPICLITRRLPITFLRFFLFSYDFMTL